MASLALFRSRSWSERGHYKSWCFLSKCFFYVVASALSSSLSYPLRMRCELRNCERGGWKWNLCPKTSFWESCWIIINEWDNERLRWQSGLKINNKWDFLRNPKTGANLCHNEKKVPDEWQARQATQAILQVSSSKHNAKKITTRVRGPFHQSITAILTEEKTERRECVCVCVCVCARACVCVMLRCICIYQ